MGCSHAPAVWIPAKVAHTITMWGMVAMRTLYLKARLTKALPRDCCVVNDSAPPNTIAPIRPLPTGEASVHLRGGFIVVEVELRFGCSRGRVQGGRG